MDIEELELGQQCSVEQLIALQEAHRRRLLAFLDAWRAEGQGDR
jgi:hypothetical protein